MYAFPTFYVTYFDIMYVDLLLFYFISLKRRNWTHVEIKIHLYFFVVG